MIDSNDLVFLRMFNGIVAAIGFALLASVLLYIRQTQGTGHKRLMLLGIIMFGSRSVSLMFAVWAIYVGNHKTSVWFSTLSSMSILVCAGYLLLSRKDVINTLRRSEVIDQVWDWRITNAKQIALNAKHIADVTYEQVTRLSH